MRVLVTGHLGYIGGILLPMLFERRHEVVGCDNNYFSDCLYQPWSASCTNLNQDVRDLDVEDLKGFEAVIHLAGLSNDPLGNFNPALTIEINQRASEVLAVNASSAGVRRFLFASSCSNYGASDGAALNEQAPFNPQTAYGHSKVAAEKTICGLVSSSFEPCNLRAGTVYGLAPRIRFDLVVNNLVAFAVATSKVLLKSDGKAWRPLVHVSDVARAYVAALEASAQTVSGESFNIGRTDENYQIIDVAKIICNAIPGCEIELTDEPISDTRNYRVNCDKIVQCLPGYRPQWRVDEGVLELYTAFQSSPVLVADFEGQRFNRLVHLQKLVEAGRVDASLRPVPTS
ncbi:MAG: SDR family oxidoreductase [Desulfobacterales bacterium]|nr:SDR family oxidoreductase [Desulfobacterales bacterium]